MIELLQTIAGVVVMVADGIAKGIAAVGQLVPFAYESVNYLPQMLIFPCTLIISYSVCRFVLSLF